MHFDQMFDGVRSQSGDPNGPPGMGRPALLGGAGNWHCGAQRTQDRLGLPGRPVRYGVQLLRRNDMRRMVLILFTLAFAAAGIAGLFGAFITKAAPVA